MRMWMVDPRGMCRKHLLGEHVEVHMLAGSIKRGWSVAGFLAKGLLEPQYLAARHAVLASEMVRRGYRHVSPLAQPDGAPKGRVDRPQSMADLVARCPECAERNVL